MSALPKPQPCGQNWLAMQPTANGRLCGQCDKEIYDFSGMPWPAIVRTQAEHGNSLCGMYAPEQLKHWGQMPPPSACAKLAAATTLALALSAIPAAAQTPGATPGPGGRTLSGTVTVLSAKGKPEPVSFATVILVGTQIGIVADEHGHYELALPDEKSLPQDATIQFNSLGFARNDWPLPPPGDGPLQHDVLLAKDPNISLSFFSVRKPSLPERAKWTLKRWFGRRQE